MIFPDKYETISKIPERTSNVVDFAISLVLPFSLMLTSFGLILQIFDTTFTFIFLALLSSILCYFGVAQIKKYQIPGYDAHKSYFQNNPKNNNIGHYIYSPFFINIFEAFIFGYLATLLIYNRSNPSIVLDIATTIDLDFIDHISKLMGMFFGLVIYLLIIIVLASPILLIDQLSFPKTTKFILGTLILMIYLGIGILYIRYDPDGFAIKTIYYSVKVYEINYKLLFGSLYSVIIYDILRGNYFDRNRKNKKNA